MERLVRPCAPDNPEQSARARKRPDQLTCEVRILPRQPKPVWGGCVKDILPKIERTPLQRACVGWAYEQVREARAMAHRGDSSGATKRLTAAMELVRSHDRTALASLAEKVETVRRILAITRKKSRRR